MNIEEKRMELGTLLMRFFRFDVTKVIKWLNTENPLLGNVAPMKMLENGRVEKLLKFVRSQLSMNEAPTTKTKPISRKPKKRVK